MRNFGGTLIAAILVAGIAGYAYFFEFKKDKEEEAQKEKNALVLKLEKDKLARIELHRQSGPLVLEKTDGVWRLAEPVRDAADANAVSALVNALLGEKSQETVVEGDAIDWKTFGLDQPVTRLLVRTSDKRTREVKIGSVKSFDGQLYARVSDDKSVLLVSASWDAHLSKPVNELRDKRLLRAEEPDFDRLQITRRSGRSTKLVFVKKDGSWTLAEGGDSTIPISHSAVDAYLDKIRSLRAQDFVSEDNEGPDREKFGFNGAASVEVVLSKQDQKPFSLMISALKPGDIEKDKKSEDENYRFAISSDGSAIAKVQKSDVQDLGKNPEDFYDKKFPFQLTEVDVNEVEVDADGVKLKAKKQGDKWTLVEPSAAGKELDSEKMGRLVSQVASMQAERFYGKTSARSVHADKNRLTFFNVKGENLLRINWGDVVSESHPNGPRKLYRVKTSKSDQTFGVFVDSIKGLPLKDLLQEKPAPTATPAALGSNSTKTSAAPPAAQREKENGRNL